MKRTTGLNPLHLSIAHPPVTRLVTLGRGLNGSHRLIVCFCSLNDREVDNYPVKSGPTRNAVQGQNIGYKGSKIEQGSFTITNEGIKRFDREYELGAENTFKGDKAAVAGAFTGKQKIEL